MTADLEQLAWAAGLFEGEGCIYFAKRHAGRPVLQLTSTDEDVITRFQEIVRCGTLTLHRPAREGWKPSWQWHLGKADEILLVLGRFWPYLGERRQEKATEAIERAVKIGQGPTAPSRYRERVA